MKVLKLPSQLILPLLLFSFASCSEGFVERYIEIQYLKVDSEKINFESESSSKTVAVKTSFTFVDVEVDEEWCTAALNDDNTVLTITVGSADVPERTATVTLTATGCETKITVLQSALNDVKITILGARPDRDEIYAPGNEIEKAWDVDDEGNGNPGTWWITPNSGNTFPFDIVFLFGNAPKMDYFIYTPKQHPTSATNVNGCLGRVEIWYTSAADPAAADHSAFTRYGEYDWKKSRALPGPVIAFTPALENVTGIKLRILEAGGGAAAGGYIGIGDIQFWKLGAGKTLSTLDLSENALSFGMTGEPQAVTLTTNISDITVTAPDSWCRALLADGEITVTVDPNDAPGAAARTSTISVTGENITKTITVSQEGPRLATSENSLIFEAGGGEKVLDVITNLTGVTVSKPETDTWYTAVLAGNKLTVNAAAAGEGMATSEITLTAANGLTKKVEVARKGLNDIQIAAAGAWARTFNPGNEVEKSYDGNHTTWYMANYKSSFPVDVVYYFRNADRLSHIVYYAKTNNVNGRLGKVEILYSTVAYPTPDPEAAFVSAGVYDWERSADVRVVKFPEQIANPTAVKLRILEAGGGSSASTTYAGIKEIEFYKIGSEPTPVFELDPAELDFGAAAESKTVTVNTNLPGNITAAVQPAADTWCTPTVSGAAITVRVDAAAATRTTRIVVTAPNGETKTIAVTQTVPDIKLTVTGAKPDTDDIYAAGNEIEKAYDGNPATWWVTKNNVVHTYPYDVVFFVASDRMDYLVYYAKQHSSPANVNGCLGRVEIWYTTAADPANAAHSAFTKYGAELDWEKTRIPVERRVDFSPALTNVTAVKLRLLEPGNSGSVGSDPVTGWAGIGDMGFFKRTE